ncbi:MAG: alpha/beta hydrolase [Pseudomonadota bacterium]
MITDWDDAYANRDHIADADGFPPRWAALSARFRDMLGARARIDIPYGEAPRNRFDLFLPDGAVQGLLVFIHGGYWRAFDKSSWSWLATGPLAHGWAVAMPSYTLAPGARISAITAEIGAAIAAAAAEVAGPIRLSGHSAGGHLAARMITTDSVLPPDMQARIGPVTPISGVFDLRPLLRTAINDDLHLDEAEARSESPALLSPLSGMSVTCWVGAAERPEFVRQNALLANIWHGLGAKTAVVEDAGRHHFDVIDDLADPASPLCTAVLR